MAKGLVIVESPGKVKAIQKYLGKGFAVEASFGHVKDLPKSTLGVDIDNGFETEYVVIPGKEKVVAKLKKLALSVDTIYLASDPDREGEAIAAHLAEELGDGVKKKKKKKKGDEGGERIRRVTFNEITKRAVNRRPSSIPAISTATWLMRNRRGAFWTAWSVTRFLRCFGTRFAAGFPPAGCRPWLCADRRAGARDQGVSEAGILDHLTLISAGPKPPSFDARFLGKGEEKIEVTNGEQAEQIRAALERAEWRVRSVDRKERRQCDPSIHHQQAAAGFLPQAAFQREAHHDDRSTPL